MGAIKTLLTFAEFERMEDEEPGKTEPLGGELTQLPLRKRSIRIMRTGSFSRCTQNWKV
jgi:hypothetical protein